MRLVGRSDKVEGKNVSLFYVRAGHLVYLSNLIATDMYQTLRCGDRVSSPLGTHVAMAKCHGIRASMDNPSLGLVLEHIAPVVKSH